MNPRSRLLTITTLACIVSTALALAVNYASDKGVAPGPLRVLQNYPWWSVLLLTALALLATMLADHRRTAELDENEPSEIDVTRSALLDLIHGEVTDALDGRQRDLPKLQLRFAKMPGVVDSPLGGHIGNTAPVQCSQRTTIITLAKTYRDTFLLLGEAGSGKTDQLLWLAQYYCQRAHSEQQAPIPFLPPLPRWRPRRGGFEAWLTDELVRLYGLSVSAAAAYIEGNQLVLMLDQLDLLPIERRIACVSAINEFRRKRGLFRVIVTCRMAEYLQVEKRLQLEGACEIQPLEPKRLEKALSGKGLEGLRMVVRGESTLPEILDSPLMVRTAILAFRDMPQDDIREMLTIRSGTKGHSRDLLFRIFYERVIAERSCPDKYSKADTHEDFTQQLARLAERMRQQNIDVFIPDRLDASWLKGKLFQRLISTGIAAASGLLIAIITVASILAVVALGRSIQRTPDPGQDYGLIVAVEAGLLLGLGTFLRLHNRADRPVEDLDWTWRAMRRHVWRALAASGFVTLVVVWADVTFLGFEGQAARVSVVAGIVSFIVCSLAFFLVGGLQAHTGLRTHGPWDGLRSSLQSAATASLVFGFAGGLLGGLVFGPASGLFVGFVLRPPIIVLAAMTLGPQAVTLAIMGLLALILLFSVPATVTVRSAQRISDRSHAAPRLWAPTALLGLVGLVLASLATFPGIITIALPIGSGGQVLEPFAYGPLGGIFSTGLGVLAIGAAASVVGWLTYGGVVWVENVALRARLVHEEAIPHDLADFLEHAKAHYLMRLSGEGYAFHHQLLRDYIADHAQIQEGS